ncbi:uncharacterized protein [Triticum aestivum]|nr:uncharacterized protein LOC123063358 isoform X3 [Triticum aestivum]
MGNPNCLYAQRESAPLLGHVDASNRGPSGPTQLPLFPFPSGHTAGIQSNRICTMPMTYPAHTFPQQPAKLLLSLRHLRSSRPFHLLFHNRPPSRSEGLRPDQPPPHHGVRRGVPGSLAVTQCGADLVVRPHQAFDALTAPSTRYRDERAVFCLLRLPRTTDATSSHRLAQHQHRPLLTG